MKLLLGNSLEVLKTLPDNSIDSVVTDPPYELGFMGKAWDNTGIAYNVGLWKEVLRVLKPGGHLLSFGGSRTYHRMATAIEDAGFEIRDQIMWVYGSGFPKSLNIGKAVDKLQGNERQVLGTRKVPDQRSGGINSERTAQMGVPTRMTTDTKGSSEWEGWGTALKPAHEPIVLARKPLNDGGLDIVQNICYNMIEKGFINKENKILWRIKLVKNVEKQKTKNYSTQTQPQKTVVASAEIVEMNEKESVGRKIQRLIENICGSGEMDTLHKQEGLTLNTTEQIRKKSYNIGKHTNEKESKTQSMLMEENASVVGRRNLNFSPLIISKVEGDNTENKLKTQISMYGSKKETTQKSSGCSAGIVTAHWVDMDIVRTIKIEYQNKTYEIEQLSDNSLVWSPLLKPYLPPKPLNVAENVLKWGTGGLNIDGCRIEYVGKTDPRTFGGKWKTDKCAKNIYEGGYEGTNQTVSPQGRFPANFLHDGSDEVVELFPNTKSGVAIRHNSGGNTFGGNNPKPPMDDIGYSDSGSAARFFYCAKASKSERDRGCEGLKEGEVVRQDLAGEHNNPKHRNNHPTVKPLALMKYLIKLVSREGQTILDPFMGSGTTGIAAKELNRYFIGIEMNAEYIEIAKRRIDCQN